MSSDECHDDAEKITQAQLKRERQHFAIAERAARFGYWRLEMKSLSYHWSPGLYDLLGADPAQQSADVKWLLDRLVPEDTAKVTAAIVEAVRTKSSFSYRARFRHPEASARIVDTQGEVELDENGEVVAVLGVVHDVTQQVVAEEAREEAQHLYRVMTEEASDIILLYDANGELLFASQALERLLKRTAAEIEHGKFVELIHPDDQDAIANLRTRPAPGETITAAYRVRHGDGHYVWIEVTVRAIHDGATGEFRNLVSVLRDITQRKTQQLEMKMAQERAEAASKAKSRFLANMSHELRTPLNAVIGFTDLMRQRMFGPLGNERYEEYATLIYDSGQLLLDLISDMLDMAKIEAGKLELNMERVDLTGTVEDSVRMLRDRAHNCGLELTFSAPREGVSLIGDRRAVKQILLNLLTNAIKFTPAGGHVGVSVRMEGGRATIAVRDTGIGIPDSELPRLGKPFEQVCADPMLAKSGTGLGLALVRALVEKHGGNLGIASEEGVGTEVSVDFPLTQAGRVAA
jgi:PAS domain S-box-containing protein